MNRFLTSKNLPYIIFISAAALLIRYLSIGHITPDYSTFLQPWMEAFRANGGFGALKITDSNYNLPYLYFLAAFSYIPINDLYLIKILSIIFDFVIAFTVAHMVSGFTKKQGAAVISFAAVLLWLTFWLNSAYWAQCDSIYAAFCLLSFLAAMRKHPILSVVLGTVALAFKLQAIFFLPMFIIFLIGGKVKFWHAIFAPITYLTISLPGLLLGWPADRLLSVYTGQVELYSSYLTLNAPSMFALLPQLPKIPFFQFGIIAAVLFVILLFVAAFKLRKELDEKLYVLFAAAFCIGLPWFLPSMHERYFYLAEVFVLLYVFYVPKRWYYAPCLLYGALMGYHAYLVLGILSTQLWLAACFIFYPMVRLCIDIYFYKDTIRQ